MTITTQTKLVNYTKNFYNKNLVSFHRSWEKQEELVSVEFKNFEFCSRRNRNKATMTLNSKTEQYVIELLLGDNNRPLSKMIKITNQRVIDNIKEFKASKK
tara:strand:+ start:483 stop:785 length:303 start_codon:yes stop_codon:yes gene_type:complete